MDPFTICTYNTHCFPWTDPVIKEIVGWIVANCDVVVLQEIWCRHAAWASVFAAHGWTFLRPVRENHIAAVFGSGLAVAWRSRDWQLGEARLYPFLNYSGIDALVTKGWFRVELTQRSTGKVARIINTHMQADYDIGGEYFRTLTEPIRMAQAWQLVEVERRMPRIPTLIVGDMNTEECWFRDTMGWMQTTRDVTFPETEQIIDHCTTWAGTACKFTGHTVHPLLWSDHCAVTWRIAFG